MEVHERRRTFRTLDGLRGVAALLVVQRHIGPMGISLPNTFLAVDLFFLLSGFVLAHAYDARLEHGRFVHHFLLIRLIRLYPLFLAGLAIGIIANYGGTKGLKPGALIESAIFGALMLPALPFLPGSASSLNAPAWTLPLELCANLVYAAFFPIFRIFVLAIIVTLGAIGIVICGYLWGNLDLGWAPEHLPIALSRVGFSFFAGVLLFRTSPRNARYMRRPVAAWGILIALAGLLIIRPWTQMGLAYQETLIVVVFPVLVWLATICEPDYISGKLFRFIGLISYAIYATHQPLGLLIVRATSYLFHPDWGAINYATAIGFTVTLIPACWALDEFYDAPARRWLQSRLVEEIIPRKLE